MNSDDRVSLLSLSCREASRLISESLDRELTRREQWSLRFHKALCRPCQRFATQIKAIRECMANMPDLVNEKWTDSTKLSPTRRAQIKRLLAEALRNESHE
jgi:hypothetical protein